MIVATVVNPLSPSFFSSFVSDCLASETKPAASMKAKLLPTRNVQATNKPKAAGMYPRGVVTAGRAKKAPPMAVPAIIDAASVIF